MHTNTRCNGGERPKEKSYCAEVQIAIFVWQKLAPNGGTMGLRGRSKSHEDALCNTSQPERYEN